jgi:predicted site-specific integrase-resolvase
MSNRIAPPTVLQTPGGSTPDKEAQLMKSVSQTTKRAVLYARVSTKEQAEKGYSMVQQLDALRSYCEREGIESWASTKTQEAQELTLSALVSTLCANRSQRTASISS